jgi:precorrin-2 dehydrogenase
MGYLPIFLEVGGRKCIVVGGGEIAARKIVALVEAKAVVSVVSPGLTPVLAEMAEQRIVTYIGRTYRRGDMKGSTLVYAATGDPALDRELAAEARELGIPLNVADVPELCTFIVPAVAKRGALRIAISTSGASPAFSARIRREIEAQFGFEYGLALEILRAARTKLRAKVADPAERARRLTALADSTLPEALHAGDCDAVERLLAEHLGDGTDLTALGVNLARIGSPNRHGISR